MTLRLDHVRGLLLLLAAAVVAGGLLMADRDTESGLPPAPPLRVPQAAEPADNPAAVTLGAVARCESRGDPTAVSADGLYRGKYQFDLPTWQSVGGTGDPALASEQEQDRRARALAVERGTAPWPVCGS
jgi:hypothetical protein